MSRYILLIIMMGIFAGCSEPQQEEAQKNIPTVTPIVTTPTSTLTVTSETAALSTPMSSEDNEGTESRFLINTILWRGVDSGYLGTTLYYNNGDVVRTSEMTKEEQQ